MAIDLSNVTYTDLEDLAKEVVQKTELRSRTLPEEEGDAILLTTDNRDMDIIFKYLRSAVTYIVAYTGSYTTGADSAFKYIRDALLKKDPSTLEILTYPTVEDPTARSMMYEATYNALIRYVLKTWYIDIGFFELARAENLLFTEHLTTIQKVSRPSHIQATYTPTF